MKRIYRYSQNCNCVSSSCSVSDSSLCQKKDPLQGHLFLLIHWSPLFSLLSRERSALIHLYTTPSTDTPRSPEVTSASREPTGPQGDTPRIPEVTSASRGPTGPQGETRRGGEKPPPVHRRASCHEDHRERVKKEGPYEYLEKYKKK